MSKSLFAIFFLCVVFGQSKQQNSTTECGFYCKSDGKCIPKREECNGIVNCVDGSDETEDCHKYWCPGFLFRCKYGACISRKQLCDGFRHCADNSDEMQNDCPKKSTLDCSDKNHFRCQSGQCIIQKQLCDGTFDCSDHSDETSACKSIACPSFLYRCKYGACVDPTRNLQSIENCLETVQMGTDCTVPKQPQNGLITTLNSLEIKEPKVAEYTVLTIRCNSGFVPNKNSTFCQNGQWTDLLTCTAISGQVSGTKLGDKVPCCSYGSTKNWHASLYRKLGKKFKNICGGTVLTPKIVITGAHCATGSVGQLLLAAGKPDVPFNSPTQDVNAQYRKVRQIVLPNDQKLNDLALLILQAPFEFNYFIGPICRDYLKVVKLEDNTNGFAKFIGPDGDFLQDYPVVKVAKDKCGQMMPDELFCIQTYNNSLIGGTGFAVQNSGLFYLKGVQSGQVKSEQFAKFTNIELFDSFIDKNIQLFDP